MRIGVPKESKNHEYRVGLNPPSVAELVAAGHEVVVETKAGSGIDFEDQDYIDAGATILADPAAVFAAADHVAHADVVLGGAGAGDADVPGVGDLRAVAAGDPCTVCGSPLEVIKGIEVGHIFKLGYKYSDALELSVLGPDGKPVKPVMGCYGIGVERAMAACIEVHHDEKGIAWPAEVAPYAAHLVEIGAAREPQVSEVAARLHALAAEATHHLAPHSLVPYPPVFPPPPPPLFGKKKTRWGSPTPAS